MSHPSRKKREAKAKKALGGEARIILKHHNKDKKKKPSRRKSPEEMLGLIHDSYIDPSKYVRNPDDWVSKSYNLNKQKIDFIRWVYCLYPVPQFMLELFTDKAKSELFVNSLLPRKLFFKWFIIIATGGSFAKYSKEIFTKKEAHLFLNAPDNNTIIENIWWAKCKSIDLGRKVTHAIVKRLFRNINPPRHYLEIANLFWWQRLLILLKNCEDEVSIESLNDIMDFLRDRHNNSDVFDLKGRTFNSLIKLSNEWHRTMQFRKFGNQNFTWRGIDIPDWNWTDKKQTSTWTVTQLLTSKELFNDGKRMRHCVASYGQRCMQGQSAIFSLMEDDGMNMPEKHVTIELSSSKQLIQANARMNRQPKGMAKLILNKWLSHNGIDRRRSWVY